MIHGQAVTQKIELVQRFHSPFKFPTMSVSVASSFLPSTNVLAIKILPSVTTGVRRPFHLALTIDTSGSMDGPRIQAVKRTLHLLIDAMADDDVLSLISYSHESQIDANATVLSEVTRPVLHEIVNRLEANGGTNMESAFVALGSVASPAIDAVFLLTDGQINQGISVSSGLQRILGSILAPGTPVNTLGFGADHNIRLLRDMAMRSRGSYTYADADEMLPAIIGDIMGGLATETGRNGVLTIPAGWRCLELGCEANDTQYVVGTLIAEKEQWIVLEGPEDASASGSPTFQFQWSCGAATHVEIHTTGDTIPAIVVAEQRDRVHVAGVFSRVTDMLENNQTAEAKTALTELGNYLDSSTAKGRPFVIRLHAQVDEMLDMISSYPVLGPPPLMRGFGGTVPEPPLLAPALSRMASNTAALGVQRGFFTNGAGAIEGSYSSPTQAHNRRVISTGYTQLAEHDI